MLADVTSLMICGRHTVGSTGDCVCKILARYPSRTYHGYLRFVPDVFASFWYNILTLGTAV